MARDTVSKAVSSEAPPRYARAPAGSKLDPFKDWICEQLRSDPSMQSLRLREMAAELGYEGGKTIFDDFVREVRPRFVVLVAVGHGQSRRGWVVTAELCWSCVVAPALIFRRFATLDVLVNNAAASLRTRDVTREGFERTWATNVLGPHLLTTLLVPDLRASGHGRIVNVSTRAAEGLDLSDTQYERRRYSAIGAYRASKQASRLLTWALAGRLSGEPSPPTPSIPATDPQRDRIAQGSRGPQELHAQAPLDGADTAIWLAASAEVEGATAGFWSKRHELACRFRDSDEIHERNGLVEQQLSRAGALEAMVA